MLANNNRSQFNSKVVSILERASSKSSDKGNTNLFSQKFSQSNQNKPALQFSQTFSSQEYSNLHMSPQFDSQKYSFGQPVFSQRAQTFSEQMNSSITRYMQNNGSRPMTNHAPFISENVQDMQANMQTNMFNVVESEPVMTFPQQKTQSSYINSFQNSARFTTPKTAVNQHENDTSIATIHQNHLAVPSKSFHENNLVQPRPVTQEKTSEETLIDGLEDRLVTSLNMLKLNLKNDIKKCSGIADAQATAMNKFNEFYAGLRQILETYNQFETQLKNIEDVFLQQVGLVLKAFDVNTKEIGALKTNVMRRIGLNNHGLLKVIGKLDFKPIKRSITKAMLKVKETKRKETPFIHDYETVRKPFPSYATAHHYNTRTAVALPEEGKQDDQVIVTSRMEIEISTEKTERKCKKAVSFKEVPANTEKKAGGVVNRNNGKKVPWRS